MRKDNREFRDINALTRDIWELGAFIDRAMNLDLINYGYHSNTIHELMVKSHSLACDLKIAARVVETRREAGTSWP